MSLSKWFNDLKEKVVTEYHHVLDTVRPALEDLATHSAAALEPVLLEAGLNIKKSVEQAKAEGKDLTSRDVIGDLISAAAKTVGESALKAELPVLQTTEHAIAANLVASALDIQPVNYAKLNN